MKKLNLQIYNKDCIKVLKRMVRQKVKVDHIITDPPYEIGYDEWDGKLDWSTLFRLFDKITQPHSNIILFQGWSNVCNTISKAPKSWTLKNWIIYDRIKGRGAKTNLVSTREDILWFVKSDKYTYHKQNSRIEKKTGGLGQKNGNKFRTLSNVWSDVSPIVPWSPERVKHPTQKPIMLMKRCVKLWSSKGQTILDPFMGSGSTGVACKKCRRKFIGIELNKDYYKIAKNRLK